MRRNKILLASITVLAVGVLVLVIGRTRIQHRNSTPREASPTFMQNGNGADKQQRYRNLSLQPEAFNMGQRLGSRFTTETGHVSVVNGVIIIGSENRHVQIKRLQTDSGEQVEIKLAGANDTLTWKPDQGPLSSGRQANEADRELIEKLVLDSPDQFVLAQLRGATYDVIARNVRPANATDPYVGPLWNVVRVGEPGSDDAKRPQSRWRLYYLNTKSGLIDRIESAVQGEKTVAAISWSKVGGEQVPSEIVWSRQNQTVLTYRLSNFSHAAQ